MVDHLEKHSYARRDKNPEARRSLLITLTPARRHAAAWAYQELTDQVTAATEALTADQVDELATGVTGIGRYLLTVDTAEPSAE